VCRSEILWWIQRNSEFLTGCVSCWYVQSWLLYISKDLMTNTEKFWIFRLNDLSTYLKRQNNLTDKEQDVKGRRMFMILKKKGRQPCNAKLGNSNRVQNSLINDLWSYNKKFSPNRRGTLLSLHVDLNSSVAISMQVIIYKWSFTYSFSRKGAFTNYVYKTR
jgi:hypothetical protein